MNNNSYLIPANANRGKLIMGFFRPIDITIFGIGVSITIILLLIFQKQTNQIGVTILIILPALISGILVWPLPQQYHNVLVFLTNMYHYYTSRQRYYWRGWCANVQRKRK